MTSPSISITLGAFFEEKEAIFFTNRRELAKKSKINIIPTVSHISGLKNINPKNRFRIIKNGKKQPVFAKNKADFIRFSLK